MRTQLVILALLVVALAPTSSAAPPEPECVQVYRELTPPPVAVTLVNGCTVEVEVTTGSDGCQLRYLSGELGPVFVESRDSCHYALRASAEAPEVTTTSSAMCPDIYWEYEVGPVRVVSPNGCTRYVYVFGKQVYPTTIGTAAPDRPCMEVYNQWDLGPATVTQYDSCTYDVEVDRAAVATAAAPPCYDVYREYEAGPVKVVQRDSCSAEVYYNDRPLLEGLITPASSTPPCYPVYQEHQVGPVKVVRRNSCSAEVYLFGEPLLR